MAQVKKLESDDAICEPRRPPIFARVTRIPPRNMLRACKPLRVNSENHNQLGQAEKTYKELIRARDVYQGGSDQNRVA